MVDDFRPPVSQRFVKRKPGYEKTGHMLREELAFEDGMERGL